MDKFELLVAIERTAFALPQLPNKSHVVKQLQIRAQQADLRLSESPHKGILLQSLASQTPIENYLNISKGKKDIDAIIMQKALAHQYSTAIPMLEASHLITDDYVKKSRSIMRLYILAANYQGVLDVDMKLKSFLCLRPLHEFSDVDRKYLFECNMLTFAALYLQGEYFNAISYFFGLLCESERILQYLESDEEYGDVFITKSEYCCMILLSVLAAIPLHNYKEFIALKDTQYLFHIIPCLLRCLNLMISNNYDGFFAILNGEIQEEAKNSYFLAPTFSTVSSLMGCKVLFLYLKFSTRIKLSYLSEKIGIDYSRVQEYVSGLINKFHLNFTIDGDLVYYHNKSPTQELITGMVDVQSKIDAKIAVLSQKNEALKEFIQHAFGDEQITTTPNDQIMATGEVSEQSEEEEYKEDTNSLGE